MFYIFCAIAVALLFLQVRTWAADSGMAQTRQDAKLGRSVRNFVVVTVGVFLLIASAKHKPAVTGRVFAPRVYHAAAHSAGLGLDSSGPTPPAALDSPLPTVEVRRALPVEPGKYSSQFVMKIFRYLAALLLFAPVLFTSCVGTTSLKVVGAGLPPKLNLVEGQ